MSEREREKEKELFNECLRTRMMSPMGFQYFLGGAAVGVLLTGFMPRNMNRLARLAPFYVLGALGILVDDYRVTETCKIECRKK